MYSEKISIIIVTLNAAKTVGQAIESVLGQTYENYELIIIDGQSTDGTIDIIKEYATKVAVFISEKDKGIYDAMNKGISRATGDRLLFLGADDRLCPGILQTIFAKGGTSAYDILYGQIQLDGTGKFLGSPTNYNKLIENNIPHQGIFYKKKWLEEYRGYNLKYKILADYNLNLRLFENGRTTNKFIPEAIAIFYSGGISNRTIDTVFFNDKLLYFTQNDGLSKKDKRLAKYYFFSGVALVLKKQYRKGFGYIGHAIVFSGRKTHFALLAIQFLFSLAGFGKKYKYV